MTGVKQLLRENKQLWFALYIIPYLIWFVWLEVRKTPSNIHIIGCSLDNSIPFCEYFIVPYLLWFVFLIGTWFYLCFNDKAGFYPFITYLYSGMTLFLIVSTVFPNGLNLRVSYDADKNVFTWLTSIVQSTDTPTNVFPSIHVYNSIVACVALWKNGVVKKHPVAKALILLLTISICLSTVFLKQHSLVDVAGACVISAIFYWVSYIYIPKMISGKSYEPAIEK